MKCVFRQHDLQICCIKLNKPKPELKWQWCVTKATMESIEINFKSLEPRLDSDMAVLQICKPVWLGVFPHQSLS